MNGVILAIDQGTTSSTALVFTEDGSIIGTSSNEIDQSYPKPGWVEQDPDEIWNVSLSVMRQAILNANCSHAQVKAIGISNQRETTLVWERATGIPIHPAIVWQSRQSSAICERLRAAGFEAPARAKTGLVIDPYFSASKILWLFDRYPDLYQMAQDGKVLFGTIDSWLLWNLTGRLEHATDPTNASRTLLYNIHDQQWDADLLKLFDIPAVMLPAVKPSCGVFGETIGVKGLPDGIPVSGIAGDQQAALYGQGCWETGAAKVTYGTGAFVVMNLGQQHPVLKNGLLTSICCDEMGHPAYSVEGAIFTAGAAVQWLSDGLQIIDDAAESESLAQQVPHTDGVYFVPAFTGLGVPYWDMDARGALVGLTRGTNRLHIVRAVLESLAYQTLDVVEAMRRSGVALTELRSDGGAAANNFLMQFQADLLGVPIDRPNILETTASGAAFLAGLGIGFWRNPKTLRTLRHRERIFKPNMTKEKQKDLYDGWRKAVNQVLTPSP